MRETAPHPEIRCITDHLYHHAGAQPQRPFVLYGDRSHTYGEMASLVAAYAGRLARAGVAAGDRVALVCGNRPAFLVAWFAINEIGAIAVPLNTGLRADSLRYTLRQSEARLLLIEPELLEARKTDIASIPSLEVWEIDASMEEPDGDHPRHRPAAQPSAHDPACILYTSGTTGLPKGVVLPNEAYVAAGRDMAESLGLAADERIMVFLPLFHANPQMYAVTSALRTGASIALIPKFSASRFFEDAARYQATGFTYVGTVLAILEKHHPRQHLAHSIKWCVGGGAPRRVWEEIEQRFGIAVRELYGMTETGAWVSMNVEGATRFGSVGSPRRRISLSIRDEQGTPLPTGHKGEIVARASQPGIFFTEYWRNAEATAQTLKDGWLYTGDRGWLDEDGYLYFDGRVKELIRRGGEMIAPTEIEQQLLKHPAVRDCTVIGIPDEIMGEEIKAVVVADGGVDPLALREHLADRIAPHMLPRYFSFVDAIPKTETEKVKRHEVAGMAMATVDLRAPEPATNHTEEENDR
ncbi:AMP-binding protein [Alcaligenaceae bacterium]|nr:AMP-binding protein [Alcaligenaceae bacterium]